MAKVAVIVYHKNVNNIYPKHWIDRFRLSIISQTFQDFDVYEINYGGQLDRIFENSIFYSRETKTFVDAMNYLIDKCIESEYDYVFNTNVDDWYDKNRFELQLKELNTGADLVSSNFCLIKDDIPVMLHEFHDLIIEKELTRNHNIIGHPVVAYSAGFLKRNKYNSNEIPYEDMLLWKRAIERGEKIKIINKCLLFHRIHNQSVCQSENR